MSQSYRESEACRTEAECDTSYVYVPCSLQHPDALRLKKTIVPVLVQNYTPDGWLSSLIGSEPVVDFSSDDESMWLEVVQQLTNVLGSTAREELGTSMGNLGRARPKSMVSADQLCGC